MMRLTLSAAALLLLAACETPSATPRDLDRIGQDYQQQSLGSATPQNAQEATAADVCGASHFHALLGTPVSSIDRSTLPAHARIISSGMMVTQDFLPSRLNIRVAPDGKVASIECF